MGCVCTSQIVKIFSPCCPQANINVAIYGLGNIPDLRLHQTFLEGKVRWERPGDGEGSQWFHILVIHQNRVAHGQTKFIPTNFLPGCATRLVPAGHAAALYPQFPSAEAEVMDSYIPCVPGG
jgi:hypothetical protein